MIDGIQIIKNLRGQSVNMDKLYLINTSSFGYRTYKIKNSVYPDALISIKIREDKLIITGSLQYLLNHNSLHPTTNIETKKAIEILEDILSISLRDAIVKDFEFGMAIEIPFKCEHFFNNHISLGRVKPSHYTDGIYFKEKTRQIKTYNAGKNAKSKLSKSVKYKLNDAGYDIKNKEYLKYEIKYLNPLKYFGKQIIVSDLFNKEFYQTCSLDWFQTYHKIVKTGIEIPDGKKMKSNEILAHVLKSNEVLTKTDSLNQCMDCIKTLNLNASQKHDRRKTVRKGFERSRNIKNPYDISSLLQVEMQKWMI